MAVQRENPLARGQGAFHAILLAGLVLAGCAASDRGPVDSGDESWQLAPEPLLVIPVGALDEVGDPVGPSYVTWATRLPDGGVVVADHHGPGIHRFDAQGVLLRSVVRPGSGPGESRGARWVATCGTDSLFQWDYNRRMILRFTHALEYLDEVRPEGEPDSLRCRGDRGFLVHGLPTIFPPVGDSGERSTADIWITDFEARRTGRIGEFPAFEGRALGRRTFIAASGEALVVGDGEGPRVRVWQEDALGEPGTEVEIGAPPRPPTAEEYEAAIQYRSDFIASERGREVQYERLSVIRPPSSVPPYIHLEALPDGTLWAMVSAEGAPRARLMARGLEGERLADIELDHPFTLFEAGTDWLLGVRPAADGALELVLFGIDR